MIPFAGWVSGGGKWLKKFFSHADEIADAGKHADEVIEILEDAVKFGDELLDDANRVAREAAEDVARHIDDALDHADDALRIIDGKVGGKIPIDEYNAIRLKSVKNAGSDTLTLGKYYNDASSYTVRADNTMYFDMGDDWKIIKAKYGLSDAEMFEYFNIPVLDAAIFNEQTIRFSHDPRVFIGGAIVDEWEYIKNALGLTDSDLIYKGGFWYVR